MNDPNGLCQFQGIYHAFFQYSPFDAEGGVKMWGHYTSTNMIDWEYQGTALYPDQPFDCHGVYSGSAFIEDGKMYLYYTGNVKLEDGEYDYIRTGREGNTVLVMTEDGKTFGKKKELMRPSRFSPVFFLRPLQWALLHTASLFLLADLPEWVYASSHLPGNLADPSLFLLLFYQKRLLTADH